MGQKRFSQILGATVAIALLAGGVRWFHSTLKTAIASHTPPSLCLLKSGCFGAEHLLSPQPITAIATQDTGNLLVSSHKHQIDVWDWATGQQVRTLTGHSHWVTALAISPNGRTLASGSLDGTIHLWDLPSGTLRATLFARHVTTLAFSPDGSTLASGSRLISTVAPKTFHPLQLWNVATGELLTNLTLTEPIIAIAFSPDGQKLAAGSTRAWVWDLPTQSLWYKVESGDLNALIFSADGRLLLTGSDGVGGEDGIKMWDASTGKLIRVLDSVASDFALSPDGSILITVYGGNANFWRMQPFGFLGTLRGSTYSGLMATFGLNGTAIATGSSDGLRVWRVLPSPTNSQ
jgi:WD40 repeat protein